VSLRIRKSLILWLSLCLSAGLLARDVRDKWHQPDRVMDVTGASPGMRIGEIGAGRGYFTFHLARRGGEAGKVYANDIWRSVLRSLSGEAERRGLANILTVSGKISDPMLPPGLDMVYIVNAFHDLEYPVTLLDNLLASLKSGAPVVIVDRDPAKIHDPVHHFMTREEVEEVVSRSVFEMERIETFLPHHTIYVLRAGDRAGALDAEKIIQRYLEAVGGEKTRRELNSLTIRGRRVMPGGRNPVLSFPWTIHQKRGVGFRIEREFRDRVEVDVFTPTAAWRFHSAQARPRRIRPSLRSREFEAFFMDIEGPFVDFHDKGFRFEDIAREKVPGRTFLHLEMDLGGDEKMDVYFDAETGLLTERRGGGRSVTYLDYRQVGPLLFPYRIEVLMQGERWARVDTIDTILLNPDLPDSLFERPRSLDRRIASPASHR